MNGEGKKNENFSALIFLTLSNDMICLARNSELKIGGPHKWISLGPLMV